MDVYAKSQELLELIANSVYDREEKPLFFNIKEVHLVEAWLLELVKEISRESI